jgi:hypothetical protein
MWRSTFWKWRSPEAHAADVEMGWLDESGIAHNITVLLCHNDVCAQSGFAVPFVLEPMQL